MAEVKERLGSLPEQHVGDSNTTGSDKDSDMSENAECMPSDFFSNGRCMMFDARVLTSKKQNPTANQTGVGLRFGMLHADEPYVVLGLEPVIECISGAQAC
jgi:hypothetical protein